MQKNYNSSFYNLIAESIKPGYNYDIVAQSFPNYSPGSIIMKQELNAIS
jgi:hypothetical protein